MANENNLKPARSKSEARKRGRNGGKASGEVRRRNKSLREALQALLNGEYEQNGETLDGYSLLAFKAFEQAQNGSIKAFEVIRDSIGEKPTDKVEVADSNIKDIKISFVDKSNKAKSDVDPKIIGEYTPPLDTDSQYGNRSS